MVILQITVKFFKIKFFEIVSLGLFFITQEKTFLKNTVKLAIFRNKKQIGEESEIKIRRSQWY
jgi:hypothetical protein